MSLWFVARGVSTQQQAATNYSDGTGQASMENGMRSPRGGTCYYGPSDSSRYPLLPPPQFSTTIPIRNGRSEPCGEDTTTTSGRKGLKGL